MAALEVTVLGAIRREDGAFLVQRLTDPAGGSFYRPIGGGVKFDEPSDAALIREFDEELGLEIEVDRPLGTLENRFTFGEQRAHELVILWAASFTDPAPYDRERLHGQDAGGAVEYTATWRTLEELRAGPAPCYPDGILGLIDGTSGRGHGHVTHP